MKRRIKDEGRRMNQGNRAPRSRFHPSSFILHPSHRPGFSFLELILALAIAAMLSLALYQSLRVALKARQTADAAVRPTRVTSVVADLIGRDLESVMPPTGILAGPFMGAHSGGAENATDLVEFYAVGGDYGADDQPFSEGVRFIQLGVRTDTNPPMLVRRVTRNLLAPFVQEPEEEILCRNVKSFAVRYYDGTTWWEDWDSTAVDNALPVAVELILEIQTDPPRPGADPIVYRIDRLMPLACGTPAPD